MKINPCVDLIDHANVKMAEVSELSKKFQLSIPKAVCLERGWRPGQKFAFVPRGEGVLLVPVPEVDDLFGSAKGAGSKAYRDRMDRF